MSRQTLGEQKIRGENGNDATGDDPKGNMEVVKFSGKD